EMLFERTCNQRFPRLSEQGSLRRQVEVFGQLLGNGASSTLEFARFEVIESCVLDPFPIESFVGEERRIFPLHNRLAEGGRDTEARNHRQMAVVGTALVFSP